MKPYQIYRIVPLSMTLSDFWPGFQGHHILSQISGEKTAHVRDKVTRAH